MDSVTEIVNKIKSGVPVEDAMPEGADPAFWQRLADNYSQPKRRRTARRRAGSASRKTNYAAQVVGRSMVELVTRVNSQADDPVIATVEAAEFTARQHASGRVSYEDKQVAI